MLRFEETENEIICRIKPLNPCSTATRLSVQEIPKKVFVMEQGPFCEIQSYHFSKNEWSKKEAQAWVKKYHRITQSCLN